MPILLKQALSALLGALAMLLAVVIFQTHRSQVELPEGKTVETSTAVMKQLQSNPSGKDPLSSVPATPPSTMATSSVAANSTPIKGVDNKASPPPFMSEEDRLRSLQKMMADHEQAIALHDREMRDINWASRMETKLQAAFQSTPENSKARMEHADCRSQTCTVTITWPSREVAQGELALPSNMVGPIPCANRIVLPPETPNQSEYRATMLLECAGHQSEAIN